MIALLGGADYVLQSSLLLDAFTAKKRHAIYTDGYHTYLLYILLVMIKIHKDSHVPLLYGTETQENISPNTTVLTYICLGINVLGIYIPLTSVSTSLKIF